MLDRAGMVDRAGAALTTSQMPVSEGVVEGRWNVQCYDKDGKLKWVEKDLKNLIVTAGLNELLNSAVAGQTQHTAWYVGLKDTGTVAAGDIMTSHAGWTERTEYSGTRKGYTCGTVSGGSVDNSASKASFAINNTVNLYGAFLCSATSGATGVILLAAVNFTAPRAVVSGDTVNVQYTLTVTSAT